MASAGEFKAVSVDTVRPYTNDSVLLGKISLGKSRFLGAPDTSGGLHVTDTANSTSADTGAIRCAGGIGVAKTLWVGGKLTTASANDVGDSGGASLAVGGDLAVDGYVTAAGGVSCDSATASTSPSTGALTVSSDLTVLGGSSVGSTLVCASTGPAGSGASLKVDGNAGISSDLVVGGGVAVSGFVDYRHVTVTGDLTATAAIASTDPSTGAITVGDGGLTVHGAVTASGETAVAGSTTVSGASSFGGTFHVTGALSTPGGVSVGSSLEIGAGGATVAGATTCADTTNVDAATGGSLTVTGSATVAGQITAGSEVSLSVDSNVYCEEQAPSISTVSRARGIYEAMVVANDSGTIAAPLPAGAMPGGPVEVVTCVYTSPDQTAVPLDVDVTIYDAWAVNGQAVPPTPEHTVTKTLHIDPQTTSQRIVLYSGTAPAAVAVEDATLMVTFSRGDGPAVKLFFTEFWLRYVQRSWGSATVGGN